MDWDDLRYLLALSRAANLEQAALQLGVNYTTVSRRLSALQERAGVRLLEKQGRGWRLTQAGLDAVRAAEEMESQAQELERQWFGQDARLVGSLRLTTIDILGVFYTDALAEFTRRYPAIRLEINTENRAVNLTRRQADVAIRMTSSPPEQLYGRRLLRFTYRLYAASALVERVGAQAPPSSYPWLAWDEALAARVTEGWMRRHVPHAQIAVTLDASMMKLALLRAGVGVGFLPVVIGDQFPELVSLLDAPEEFNTEVWLLTHEELRGAARVRALMEHMAAAPFRWPEAAAVTAR
jgi:DNA-binding transcriptional LysR family regulator